MSMRSTGQVFNFYCKNIEPSKIDGYYTLFNFDNIRKTILNMNHMMCNETLIEAFDIGSG